MFFFTSAQFLTTFAQQILEASPAEGKVTLKKVNQAGEIPRKFHKKQKNKIFVDPKENAACSLNHFLFLHSLSKSSQMSSLAGLFIIHNNLLRILVLKTTNISILSSLCVLRFGSRPCQRITLILSLLHFCSNPTYSDEKNN